MAYTPATTLQAVEALYIGYFGRAGEPGGVSYWVNQINNGQTFAQAAAAFSVQAEAKAQHPFLANPALVSPADFVESLYSQLFGRASDATGKAYWVAQLQAANGNPFSYGLIVAQFISGAQGDDITVIQNKVTAAEYFTGKLATAGIQGVDDKGQVTASTDAAATNVISGVTKDASSVTAANVKTDAFVAGTGGGEVGVTYVLTKGVDVVPGTSNNDTIIADNTGTDKFISAADQIDGGNGTDTLKVFLAAADTTFTSPTLKSIETLYVNGGVATALDISTAAFASVKTLQIDSPVHVDAASTTYTLKGQDVQLSNLSVPTTKAQTTVLTQAAGSTPASLNVQLNNWTSAGTGVNTVDVGGASVKALNVTGTGASSKVTLTNSGAAIDTLTIAGDKGVTITEALTTLKTVTVTNTAGITLNATNTPIDFKFTGGAGNDTIKFADNYFGTITNGNQLDGGAGTADKIQISDGALTAAEYGAINQTKNFEVLGLTAAGGVTVDASQLTSIKNFSVDSTGAAVINNLAAGSTTTVTVTGATVTVGAAVGINETSLVLGSATSAGIGNTNTTTTGFTTVNVTSNGTAANTLGTLANSDNSNFVLKGAADLTVTLAAGTATGSKIDGTAFTGKLAATGSNFGDIIIGGSNMDTITGGTGSDTLTGNGGADTFAFAAAAGNNTSGGTFGLFDTITDFKIGEDKLQFTGATDVVSAQQGAVQAAVTALGAGQTPAQIAAAMATANTTSLGVSFAVYGGDTYALFERTGGSAGVNADDIFIKLQGVTTLPTFAADVIA